MSLTPQQLEHYRERGYLTGLPGLSESEVAELHENYRRILDILPPEEPIYLLAQWEKKNDYVYKLATHPRFLDYVESIIGPDFYVWDAYFFVKGPHQEISSQFHQDMNSWPLTPGKFASIFLAVTKMTSDNGCLCVVPGSHKKVSRHAAFERDASKYLFVEEVPPEDVDPEDVVDLVLKPGEVSMHHERTIHGSGPNNTDDERVGLAIRYASYDVEADLSRWPKYSIIPVRGVDRFKKNRVAPVPKTFGYPRSWDLPHHRDPKVGHRLFKVMEWLKRRRSA